MFTSVKNAGQIVYRSSSPTVVLVLVAGSGLSAWSRRRGGEWASGGGGGGRGGLEGRQLGEVRVAQGCSAKAFVGWGVKKSTREVRVIDFDKKRHSKKV